MSLIVQKYGGTSVGNTERIKNVAARVAKYRSQGDQVVVVVSAMSGVTDNLIKLAKEIMPLPSEREMDMLLATGEQTTIALTAMALHALEIKAISLTGAQAGIVIDGVYTADPRLVPSARKLDEISYDEMLELSSLGAKVMQSRSVEFAKKFGVVFEVRSSLNDNPGTIVKEETRNMEDVVIRGVSLDKNQAKVTLVGVPDKPGIAAKIFKAIHETFLD